jgi:hypothetical protein
MRPSGTAGRPHPYLGHWSGGATADATAMPQDGRHAVKGAAEGETVGRTSDPDEAGFDIVDVESPGVGGAPDRGPVRAWGQGPGTPQISVAVAAIAVLVVGIAAAGGLNGPSPSSTSPSRTADPGCRQLAVDARRPAFRLAAGEGDTGVRGLPGSSSPRFGAAYPDWHLPGPELALDAPPASDLRLVLATGACAARVEIEAAPAELGDDPGLGDRQELLRAFLDPVRHDVSFAAPSSGDWGLRILVEYWTAGPAGDAPVEAFFRVRVGSGPFATESSPPSPEPRPVVTPAASCGPNPASAAGVVLTLTTAGSQPVPGVEAGVIAPVIPVGLGNTIEIAVEGEACATSWTVDHRSGDEIVSVEGFRNATADPRIAAQNRWRFTLQGPVGERDVVVVIRFGPSLLVERTWRIDGLGFNIPEAFVVAADGRRVEAHPGCGLSIELANGYTGVDSCGSIGYEGGGERLVVEAFEPVDLEVPGWEIVGWSGLCGRITVADGTASFDATGCGLGGFSMDDTASPPPPVRFVVPPGEHVLQLSVTAVRDGDRYSVPYYVPVTVR